MPPEQQPGRNNRGLRFSRNSFSRIDNTQLPRFDINTLNGIIMSTGDTNAIPSQPEQSENVFTTLNETVDTTYRCELIQQMTTISLTDDPTLIDSIPSLVNSDDITFNFSRVSLPRSLTDHAIVVYCDFGYQGDITKENISKFAKKGYVSVVAVAGVQFDDTRLTPGDDLAINCASKTFETKIVSEKDIQNSILVNTLEFTRNLDRRNVYVSKNLLNVRSVTTSTSYPRGNGYYVNTVITEMPKDTLDRTKIINVLATIDAIINDYRNKCNQIESNRLRFSTRRPDTKTKAHQEKRKGSYVKHSIPFSCEIECYGKNEDVVAKLSKEIYSSIGMSRDGSLTSEIGYPIELQTPILSGRTGEVLIAETCTKLIENNFIVDKTCGMHIHLDGSTILPKHVRDENKRPDAVINLYLFHRIFEQVIESFLPSTRRNNNYCAKFSDGIDWRGNVITHSSINDSFHELGDIPDYVEFVKWWYKTDNVDYASYHMHERYTASRYFGANFHSLLKDNHFEIRYHSGTKNYEKILYWVDLHGSIVQKCADGSITTDNLRNIFDSNFDLSKLTQAMFSLIDLHEDTIEYLYSRQKGFLDVKESDEILIAKTKKVNTD